MNKIAAIQMCSSDNLDENLAKAHELIAEAASQGAKLIVLPEMFVLFSQVNIAKIQIKEEAYSGSIQAFLSSIAVKYNVWLVGGTIPIASDNPDKIYAACIVFNNHGEQVARYDKRHLFDVVLSEQEVYKESDTTKAGEKVIVVDTPVGRLGLCVCFDIRFPEHFEKLTQQNVEIIAIPSAFTVKTGEAHWELLIRTRAIDTFCYLIGACQGGTHSDGRKTYGHTMIVNPWGEISSVVNTPGPGIAYADIDLGKLHNIRKRMQVFGSNQA